MGLGAARIFALPLFHANQMNEHLPAMLDASFGTEQRASADASPRTARPEPLVMFDLVTSVQSRPVRLEEREFSTPDGEKLSLDIYKPGYEHGAPARHPRRFTAAAGRAATTKSSWRSTPTSPPATTSSSRLTTGWRRNGSSRRAATTSCRRSRILKVYGKEFGVDPTRLALLGRSAGGQLALLAAYTADEPAIRGVVSVYGPTDLKFGYDRPAPKSLLDTRGVLESYLGGSPAKADDAYFAASPINFVTAASPPTLLIHGLHDGHVSPEESERLEARLSQANVKHLFLRLPWATHACDWSFSGPCGQITTYAIERFLDRVMHKPAKEVKPQTRLARRQ